jgi:hypothetical protein
MIKLIDILNEVGEGTAKPYEYKWLSQGSYDNQVARFITDKGTEYEVIIADFSEYPDPRDQEQDLPAIAIDFLAKRPGEPGWSTKTVTNEGDLYRIMTTIMIIVKDVMKRFDFDVQAIVYEPSKKTGEFGSNNKRDTLYRRFITRTFPGAHVMRDPNNANIVIKIK